jgi:putative ABC transport system permease protein
MYGVEAHDPVIVAGGALLLVLVTLAAGCLLARRAARVDPMVAPRGE